jgi:hypothetical protein
MSYYKPLGVKDTSHIRDKKIYYSLQGNAPLMALFNGMSSNISIEEIYGIDYNSTIFEFRAVKSSAEGGNLGVIETSLASIYGLDGDKQSNSQPGLTILTSNVEACTTFALLSGKGAKSYKIRMQMFFPQGTVPSLKGFMSLPDQARSFDRFQLFDKVISLPENKETTVDYLVYSLKFLQKRNTLQEPCVDVDNYDKVICNA